MKKGRTVGGSWCIMSVLLDNGIAWKCSWWGGMVLLQSGRGAAVEKQGNVSLEKMFFFLRPLSSQGCGGEDGDPNLHPESVLHLIVVLAWSIACCIPNNSLAMRASPHPRCVQAHLCMLSENLLVSISWNKEEIRGHKFVKNHVWSEEWLLCRASELSLAAVCCVCACVGRQSLASFHPRCGGVEGGAGNDMEDFPQDVSIWTVSVLLEYSSRRKKYNSLSLL